MTIVHRNTSDSEKRSYAAIAAIPAIAIPTSIAAPIAAPIAVQNTFSILQDDSSESDMDAAQFDWKTVDPSDSDESDTIAYDNMLHGSTDNSANDSAEDSSSGSSQEELVVNQKHYRRVRQSWCKDGVPCFVTSIAGLLGVAYFMQFVFYMCGLMNDDGFSPAARLQCSKYHKGL